jgi:hypothetical protein
MKNNEMKTESLLREAARLSAENETERLIRELEQSPDARRMADEMFLHGRKRAQKSISRARLKSSGERLKLVCGIAAALMVLCLSVVLSLDGNRREPVSARNPAATLSLSGASASVTGISSPMPTATEAPTEVSTEAPTAEPTAIPTETPAESPTEAPTPEAEKPESRIVPDKWEGKHYFNENPDGSEPKVSYLASDEIVYAQKAEYGNCSLTEYYDEATVQPALSAEYVKLSGSTVAIKWADGDSFCLCWDDGGRTLLLTAKDEAELMKLADGITIINSETEEQK